MATTNDESVFQSANHRSTTFLVVIFAGIPVLLLNPAYVEDSFTFALRAILCALAFTAVLLLYVVTCQTVVVRPDSLEIRYPLFRKRVKFNDETTGRWRQHFFVRAYFVNDGERSIYIYTHAQDFERLIEIFQDRSRVVPQSGAEGFRVRWHAQMLICVAGIACCSIGYASEAWPLIATQEYVIVAAPWAAALFLCAVRLRTWQAIEFSPDRITIKYMRQTLEHEAKDLTNLRYDPSPKPQARRVCFKLGERDYVFSTQTREHPLQIYQELARLYPHAATAGDAIA